MLFSVNAFVPLVFIDRVLANQVYKGVDEITIPVFEGLIVFEFHGLSLKTRPETMVYRYRLKGLDMGWQNAYDSRVEYQNLPIGDYTFEVMAVDRDLVYSKGA